MRVLSGMQPSGTLHIGNYLGALETVGRGAERGRLLLRRRPARARRSRSNPRRCARQSYELIATYLAAGLDPEVCSIFLQSEVPYHAQINWLLECVATYGELSRMTQFKEKSSRKTGYRVGLLTYPVLMAGDILLYETAEVPVGDDQRQHLELTRVIAERFNNRYGQTFVVPDRRAAQGRRARDGPPRADAQDVQVDLESDGFDLRHRHARRDRQEDQEGGHRHRRRRALRLGEEARRLEPARDLLELHATRRRRRSPSATRATAI